MLAQESTQRRAPGFRPGTLLQGPRTGGAELATLRFAQTSSAFSRPEHPSARGSIRAGKVKTERIPTLLPNHRHRRPNTPGARFAGAARHGRRPSVPKMLEDLAIIHWQERWDRRCLDLPPRCRRAEWRGFSREKRRWMSERSRRRSEFSAAREKPRSEGNPGPRSGPGSRQSGVFLGYFFARAKKYLAVRSRESAWQAAGRRHVNTR